MSEKKVFEAAIGDCDAEFRFVVVDLLREVRKNSNEACICRKVRSENRNFSLESSNSEVRHPRDRTQSRNSGYCYLSLFCDTKNSAQQKARSVPAPSIKSAADDTIHQTAIMFLFSMSYLLLTLLSLSTVARSRRPSVWAVGLREDQTLDNHLRIGGRPVTAQEHRMDSNVYTAFIPDDDKAMFEAIRSDPKVGFLVMVPQDYLRKFDELVAAG